MISFLFLGFPAFWDKVIAIFCGLMIIFIAMRLNPELSKTKKYSFVEHKNTDTQSKSYSTMDDMNTPDTLATPANITNSETKMTI